MKSRQNRCKVKEKYSYYPGFALDEQQCKQERMAHKIQENTYE